MVVGCSNDGTVAVVYLGNELGDVASQREMHSFMYELYSEIPPEPVILHTLRKPMAKKLSRSLWMNKRKSGFKMEKGGFSLFCWALLVRQGLYKVTLLFLLFPTLLQIFLSCPLRLLLVCLRWIWIKLFLKSVWPKFFAALIHRITVGPGFLLSFCIYLHL